MQDSGQISPRRADCGYQPDDDSGQQRRSCGVAKHAPVKAEIEMHGKVGLNIDGSQRGAGPLAEKNSSDSAEKCEQNTFRQQLPHKAESRGAQSGANSHLAFAHGSADEQNVGYVYTSEQQH